MPELYSKTAPIKQFGDYIATISDEVRPAHQTDGKTEPDEPAIALLKLLDPTGRHNLWAKDPQTGKKGGATFEPGDWKGMSAWIAARSGKQNVYYSMNEAKAGAPANKDSYGKLSKSDIASLRGVCVDLDPGEDYATDRRLIEEKVRALCDSDLPPTVTVDSGGGFQLIWMLDEKLDVDAYMQFVEEQCYGLADILQGDTKVAEIATLLRLPGTENIPDAGKIAKGRVRRPASIFDQSGKRYSLPEIARRYEPKIKSSNDTDNNEEINATMALLNMGYVQAAPEYGDLDAGLRKKFEAALQDDPDLSALWYDGAKLKKDGTASTRRFNLGGRLHRNSGFAIEEFGALLWVWDGAVKAGDKHSDVITKREIARCWVNSKRKIDRLVDEHIKDMDEEPDEVTSAPDSPQRPTGDDNPPTANDQKPEQSADVVFLDRDNGPLDLFGDSDPARLADIPAGALPPMLERRIKDEALRKGTSEIFAAAPFLTAIGAAIGAQVRIQVGQNDDSWLEMPNLWTVLVANPGSAKSHVIEPAIKPLEQIESRWLREDEARHAKWAVADRAYKRGSKTAADPGPEPAMRHLTVDSTTMEAQIRVFRDNPRGVLSNTDELAALLGGLGASKQGGGPDRAHLLRSFEGKGLKSTRVGSGTISAPSAALSVIATTQPDKLKETMKGLFADGLGQRFIFILPDGRERRSADATPDREAAQWYVNMIEQLVTAGPVLSGPIRLTPEAGALAQKIRDRMEKLKHAPGTPVEFQGHISKWERLLFRLILIVHVVRCFEEGGGFDPSQLVDVDTVEMTGRLADLLLDHAYAFYSQYFDPSGTASEAQAIAGYLLTRPDLATIDRRTIYRARKHLSQPGNRLLLSAMAELEAFGWCRVLDRDATGPTKWAVDPLIHTRFKERGQREKQERAERQFKIAAAGRIRKEGLVSQSGYDEGVFS